MRPSRWSSSSFKSKVPTVLTPDNRASVRQAFIPPAKCLTSSRPIACALFSALRDRSPD